MFILAKILARLVPGKQRREATPAQRRWAGAVFLFLPIFVLATAHFGSSILSKASPVGIWLYVVPCMLATLALTFIWARYVSDIVSVILGAIILGVIIWLSFTRGLL